MRDIANETIVKNVRTWEDYDFPDLESIKRESDSKENMIDDDEEDLI